jgi:hypothetical protein
VLPSGVIARLIKSSLSALAATLVLTGAACSSSPAKTPDDKAIDTVRTGIRLMSQSEIGSPCREYAAPSCCAKDLARYFDENLTAQFFAAVPRGEFCRTAYRELGALGHQAAITDAAAAVEDDEITVTFKTTLVSSRPAPADCVAIFDRNDRPARMRELRCSYRKNGERLFALSNVV